MEENNVILSVTLPYVDPELDPLATGYLMPTFEYVLDSPSGPGIFVYETNFPEDQVFFLGDPEKDEKARFFLALMRRIHSQQEEPSL